MSARTSRSLRGLAAALATTVVAATLAVASAGPAAAVVDKDCDDFRSQRAAQLFFLRHGGPSLDPHRLDAEGDGIACESNPAPYYRKRTLPSAPKPPPKPPKPPARSTVRLTTSVARGITGEPLRLRSTVSPQVRRKVVVQRRTAAGAWTRVAAGRTTRAGVLVVDRRIRSATTRYRAVLVVAKVGARRYAAARSSVRTVVRRAQSVSVAIPPTTVRRHAVVARVTASPVRAGRKVALQRHTSAGWKRVALAAESRTGRARFTLPSPHAGRYTYRAVVLTHHGAVRAVSEHDVLVVTPPPDVTAPSAPTGVTAAAGDGSVTLGWNAVTAGDLDHYEVYDDAGAGFELLQVVPGTSTSVVLGGLENGVHYAFVVVAVDRTGNSSTDSVAASATPTAPDTTAPAVPTGLTGVGSAGSVALSWDAVGDSDLASYTVYVLSTADSTWQPAGGAVTALQVATSISGLTDEQEYTFAVTATDLLGNESERSAPVTVTAGAAPVG